MEMKEQTYDYTDADDIEKTLRAIFNGPCQEYFDGYMFAMAETNSTHQKIMQDPDSLKIVRKKFEDMSVIWLSTPYLGVQQDKNGR